MLKMIENIIDEMNNSKEMKDKSMLLLSESELKVLECIKRNKSILLLFKNKENLLEYEK